jgi:Domain of unknown function (DUF4184)
MPFTFSHVAAALPLRKLLGSRAVFSALAIGTMLPDLPYFLPIGVPRHVTHSEWGLLYYCLPMGLISYVAFHYALKTPLIALLPAALQSRVVALVVPLQSLPRASWLAVMFSLLVGSASHLAWDAFTHGDTYLVANVSWLQSTPRIVGGHAVPVHVVLQHASTLLGLAVLVVVGVRALRRAGSAAANVRIDGLKSWQRVAIIGSFGVCSLGTALAYAPEELIDAATLAELHAHMGFPSIQGLRAFGVAVLTYCLTWQSVRVFKERSSNKFFARPSSLG